ncbi:single-stranded-DNA-specific exonuclease RecJ [Leptospira sp. GIMC2001]|uniref:single-stranded-DNA-specific exonuclease RecJ n=1 Tax=Leptospira sp. GIMC2001 TaxID=1513297 RepID=UPI00234B826C|nr:single-stranded-DNA-specific exonuclease RecJ [Leptospira sp. GIMC2001]WCL48186.1 single-stranded-DNA-specific exonuclease RecJ [Leptospira sp. GIMC2001]
MQYVINDGKVEPSKHGASLVELQSSGGLYPSLLNERVVSLSNEESLPFLLNLSTDLQPIFFHSPFLLPDIEQAIDHLLECLETRKTILLYSDKDSDGVSSISILQNFLTEFFPNSDIQGTTSSHNEAYGLCKQALSKIRKVKPHLLITLDFGTSNIEEISELNQEGIATIVLDHHEIPKSIPPGFLINPKREDSKYPDKKICTAFLALKLCQAILFRKSSEFNRIYRIRKDLFDSEYYVNGIKISLSEVTENSALSENSTIDVELSELPGTNDNSTASRIFFRQLESIPNMIPAIRKMSSLAGIGTITDMMPLIGENRALVRYSCDALSNIKNGIETSYPGLSALLSKLPGNPTRITSKDLGWGIGPVLNAAGRMGRTDIAYSLLIANDKAIAEQKSDLLLKTNDERKERTKRNLHRVEKYFQRNPERTFHPIIFCYEPDMEPGVSGIVATRLVETYSRPAVFITPDHGQARGSIRSNGTENVLGLLERVSDLLDQFGGHPEAGGFAIEISKIPELEKKMYDASIDWLENKPSKQKFIKSDVRLNPEEISPKIIRELEFLEPTGQGNQPICLSMENIKPLNFNFLGNGKHAKFRVMGCGSTKFLIWNEGERLSKYLSLNPSISIWGSLEENFFNGKTTLQFVVSHFE